MKESVGFGIGIILVMIAVGDPEMSLVAIMIIAAIGLILMFSSVMVLKTNG